MASNVNHAAGKSAIELLAVAENSVDGVDPLLRQHVRQILRGLLFSQVPHIGKRSSTAPSIAASGLKDPTAPASRPPPRIHCTCKKRSAAHEADCQLSAAQALCNCARARFGGAGLHPKTCPRSAAFRFEFRAAAPVPAPPVSHIDADAASQQAVAQ